MTAVSLAFSRVGFIAHKIFDASFFLGVGFLSIQANLSLIFD
jgi:hypothetical protein